MAKPSNLTNNYLFYIVYYYGYIDIAKYFHEQCNIAMSNKNIIYAIAGNQLELIDYALKHCNLSIDKQKSLLIQGAIMNNNYKILEYGFSLYEKSGKFENSFDILKIFNSACNNNAHQIVRNLYYSPNFALPNVENKWIFDDQKAENKNVYFICREAIKKGNTDILRIFQHLFIVDQFTERKNLINYVVQKGYLDILKILIRIFKYPPKTDYNNIIQLAINLKHDHIIKYVCDDLHINPQIAINAKLFNEKVFGIHGNFKRNIRYGYMD
jgi:hypothetical protein